MSIGLLKYKSTDCWKQRFFTIDAEGLSCYSGETAAEIESTEPLFRIHIDKIEAVHVYLGGRFDVVAAAAGALPLLVEGGGVAAHKWADAINAAGSVFTAEETTRLRTIFRPSLVSCSQRPHYPPHMNCELAGDGLSLGRHQVPPKTTLVPAYSPPLYPQLCLDLVADSHRCASGGGGAGNRHSPHQLGPQCLGRDADTDRPL